MTSKIDKQAILQFIEDDCLSGGIHVFDSISSTNDWALDQLKRHRGLPFVCLADHQSSGRGRRGRTWLSPAGANIYLSLAWHFDVAADRLALLSLAQGVAVKKALGRIGIERAWLKWPNDILINDEKIAGILVETSGISAHSSDVVIGIGLNYRMPPNLPLHADVRWTDVAHSLPGRIPGRNELVAVLLNETVRMCRAFQASTNAVMVEVIKEVEAMKGRRVSVLLNNGARLRGSVLGVSNSGELRVEVEGEERTFNSADIRLDWRSAPCTAGDAC